MRFFVATISHTYRTIKPPWWAAINEENNIIAPGQGKKPVSVLSDEFFEE